jgi:cytochrome b subunit of formate dehydrogenase
MSSEVQERETIRYYQRLSLNQRIQHAVLIFSFTLLVVTGMPVRYYESPVSKGLVELMGGMEARALLHRIGAVIFIALCVYHALYTVFTPRGRQEFVALFPWIKDAKDIIQQLLYYFGLAKEMPRFDRYSWIEKFEYLAVAWGGTIMILTGFVLWFPSKAMVIFPKWVVDVARVAHSYEALLAFLSIIIWHFYTVHLSPDFFPMNPAFITGKLTEEQMRHHHPLEYERVRDRNELWEEVPRAPLPPEPAVVGQGSAHPMLRRPVVSVVTFTAAGAAAGIVAPLLAYLPFALAAWVLNPKGNFWGISLMPVYLLILPCMVVGAVSALVDALKRRPFASALYGSLGAAVGFCLGPVLVWLPAASIWHLISWLWPKVAANETVLQVGFWIVAVLSLGVGAWLAVWARRQGAKIGEWIQ